MTKDYGLPKHWLSYHRSQYSFGFVHGFCLTLRTPVITCVTTALGRGGIVHDVPSAASQVALFCLPRVRRLCCAVQRVRPRTAVDGLEDHPIFLALRWGMAIPGA